MNGDPRVCSLDLEASRVARLCRQGGQLQTLFVRVLKR